MELYTKSGQGLSALHGTKTEQNLNYAFSGESRAHIKYKWYEQYAREQGLMEASVAFAETAANEREHAEIWFRYLGGLSSDTRNNLADAASGEHHEWSSMYADFAKQAKEEGFDYIAGLFERVASVEKMHEQRFQSLIDRIDNNTIFTSDSNQTVWICLNCGYTVTAAEPPMKCPVCQKEKGYFMIKS